MPIIISAKVREKLANKVPPVSQEEIEQCYADRGLELFDTREQHQSDPPTRWFIAQTFFGRKLKIVYIRRGENAHIRTAYEPNAEEIEIYRKCTS